MSITNHAQQPAVGSDASVATSSGHARLAEQQVAAVPTAAYQVLLRLADVSQVKSAEGGVYITPLMVESALETVGSGRATAVEDTASETLSALPAPDSAANSFASLLAASPTLQRTPPFAANSPVVPQSKFVSQSYAAPASPQSSGTTSSAYVAGREVASQPTQQRIDKSAAKPMRRILRHRRPNWLPQIPPTLVLGLLICFTALLVGMLWPDNDPDHSPNLMPAVQETPVPGENQKPSDAPAAKVAAVPEVPNLDASHLPAKTSDKSAAAKKNADAKSKTSSPQVADKATKSALKPSPEFASKSAQEIAGQLPAPQITGIRALPPVNFVAEAPVYGQPVGGPRPHIVENPHAGGQNTVYEARRDGAQFQGNITKPDAAASHERY